jgi:hypothetical protein
VARIVDAFGALVARLSSQDGVAWRRHQVAATAADMGIASTGFSVPDKAPTASEASGC